MTSETFVLHLSATYLPFSQDRVRVELNDIKFEIHVEYYKLYGPLGRLSAKTVTGTSLKTKLFLPEYDMNFIQFLCHAQYRYYFATWLMGVISYRNNYDICDGCGRQTVFTQVNAIKRYLPCHVRSIKILSTVHVIIQQLENSSIKTYKLLPVDLQS